VRCVAIRIQHDDRTRVLGSGVAARDAWRDLLRAIRRELSSVVPIAMTLSLQSTPKLVMKLDRSCRRWMQRPQPWILTR